jgi:hypothetical protein
MSKWNLIVSGRRALAALRDLSRRWCLGVGSRPRRGVTANGFGPEARRARGIIAERCVAPRIGNEARRFRPHQCARKLRRSNSSANPLPKGISA